MRIHRGFAWMAAIFGLFAARQEGQDQPDYLGVTYLRIGRHGRSGLLRTAKRLHDRWGGATEEEYEFPPKPPRMRWATYNRLEEQYDELENQWALGILTSIARLKKRCSTR